MFVTTFLGHQGWLVRSARTCLLIDPLLCEEFGQAHALDYRVWPPRRLRPEHLPPVDAVLLSHEHDDHFDVPSLCRVDRRVPIFLSARSSSAAYRLLRQLGFQVHPLIPGAAFAIGDLGVLPLFGDHAGTYTGDEWDALPFVISQQDGAGSLFSMVDVEMTPAHLELARGRVARPGLVTWTNNALDWSHVYTHQAPVDDETGRFVQLMDADQRMIAGLWGQPCATLMCAGGFSFHGARAWLNGRVFHADGARIREAMRLLYPSRPVYDTRPGQTFHLIDNRLERVEDEAPFLGTLPEAEWPSRARGPAGEPPDYAPATGRRELSKKDLQLLRQRLAELAVALVGSVLFKSLYSLVDATLVDRAATFALVLRHGAQRTVLEYNPNGCSFDPGSEDDPRGVYLAGMECWASDLLAVLGGELGHIALGFGRSVIWNALPQRFNFSLADDLQRLSHPLARPDAYLRSYERLAQQASGARPIVLPR